MQRRAALFSLFDALPRDARPSHVGLTWVKHEKGKVEEIVGKPKKPNTHDRALRVFVPNGYPALVRPGRLEPLLQSLRAKNPGVYFEPYSAHMGSEGEPNVHHNGTGFSFLIWSKTNPNLSTGLWNEMKVLLSEFGVKTV